MKTVKVRRIGNSLGVILPKELLSSIQAAEGEELSVSVTDSSLRLSVINQDVANQVEVGRDIASRYRSTLRNLAK